AAHVAHLQAHHPFDGLARQSAVVERTRLVAQQQARVEALRYAKYESILKANHGITFVRGFARFKDAHTLIAVRPDGGELELRTDRILIATGASPAAHVAHLQAHHPFDGLARQSAVVERTRLVAQQ
ncbi:hypothetical protein, partial [Streptococcus pneumoniae]|uniref:hypothetical protein n=1 Tax=Streptococcus pneumoniae TaxID=1313 RepID=UPI003F693BA4